MLSHEVLDIAVLGHVDSFGSTLAHLPYPLPKLPQVLDSTFNYNQQSSRPGSNHNNKSKSCTHAAHKGKTNARTCKPNADILTFGTRRYVRCGHLALLVHFGKACVVEGSSR
eukprot:8307741-Pyramimonas_sp.AAC.1